MCEFYQITSNGLQAIQFVHELFDCPSYVVESVGQQYFCYFYFLIDIRTLLFKFRFSVKMQVMKQNYLMSDENLVSHQILI